MKKLIDSAIANLEKIPVAGVNAILMGEALKDLLLAKEQAPEEEDKDAED